MKEKQKNFINGKLSSAIDIDNEETRRVLSARMGIDAHSMPMIAHRAGFVTRKTADHELDALIRNLFPVVSKGQEMIRLGSEGDGGYLVPDDLIGIRACFSPGVGSISAFEEDCANLGMNVFLADKSVEGPAESHELFDFIQKNIGAVTNDDFMTMDDWVVSSLPEDRSDLLLQMDIDGAEYETFLGMSHNLMQRFRIIVAEFHDLDHLWSEPCFKLISRAFYKILQTHTCVHIHPNNTRASVRKGHLEIPKVAEFTFLRTDRIQNPSFATVFPHPLDCDNTKDNPSLTLPSCWHNKITSFNQETIQAYQAKINELLEHPLPYPQERFKGQGIVICGDRERYFPSAWVCINMLRRWGCELPIELWYLGAKEMDAQMIELVRPLNVQCVDAYQVAQEYSARTVEGRTLKPYAIMHSRFEEVLFLDADNVPVQDPTFLFSTPQYKKNGAIFWPDLYTGEGCGEYRSLKREAWDICQVPYRDEAEFETGQLVIDKKPCWLPLQLAMHLNEHHDFYYAFFCGDKDTFHLSWHRVGQPYALAPNAFSSDLSRYWFQHDFDGKLLFLHRTAHFNLLERAAFEELTENGLCQYILHGELESIPELPSQGTLLIRSDFIVDLGIKLPSPISWMVLENSDRELVLGLRNEYHIFGFLKKTVAQKWEGSLLIDGHEGMVELMPLNWDKLALPEKAFWQSRQKLLCIEHKIQTN